MRHGLRSLGMVLLALGLGACGDDGGSGSGESSTTSLDDDACGGGCDTIGPASTTEGLDESGTGTTGEPEEPWEIGRAHV